MPDFIASQPGVLEGAMEALQYAKTALRSAESSIEKVLPLVEDKNTEEKLTELRESCAKGAMILQGIYSRNAKEVFKK